MPLTPNEDIGVASLSVLRQCCAKCEVIGRCTLQSFALVDGAATTIVVGNAVQTSKA